jgi:hypothetical protein
MKMNIKIQSEIIEKVKKKEIAFLTGNGVNSFPTYHDSRSWKQLLVDLGDTHGKLDKDQSASILDEKSITYPEFFDLIVLASRNNGSVDLEDLKKGISSEMVKWESTITHENLISRAISNDIQILTTNFDTLLPLSNPSVKDFHLMKRRKGNLDAIKPLILRSKEDAKNNRGFTSWYPWNAYYSNREVSDNLKEFGIWYMHGIMEYSRSIRLGLLDYMKLVDRASDYLPEDNKKAKKDISNTFLNILLNKDLLVFGLALESNETFLRWLLLQRNRLNPNLKGYFVLIEEFDDTDKNKFPFGKDFFLKQLNFEVVRFKTASEFYESFISEI